jgi:hypothetical protein
MRSNVSFTVGAGTPEDPDIVYYNADIINDNQTNQVAIGADPVIRFQETRSTALIKDISLFNFSIVRFTMDGPNKDLPLFLPTVQLGQSDVDLTAYSIGIKFKPATAFVYGDYNAIPDIYARGFVKYLTETAAYYAGTLPFPNAPLTSQDIRGVYYFVYTYQHWLTLCNLLFFQLTSNDPVAPSAYFPEGNLAYQFAITYGATTGHIVPTVLQLPTASAHTGQTWAVESTGRFYLSNGTIWILQTSPALPNSNQPPQFQYDATTGLFSLFVSGDYLYPSPIVPPFLTPVAYTMYFNTNMFGLFTNFANFYIGNEANGQVNQLIFQNKLFKNYYVDPSNSLSWFIYTQEHESTSSLWSPISSLVFTSTLIPIFPENTGQPIVFGGTNNNPNSSTSAFQPIITDIALPMSAGAYDYRTFIEYLPSAEYRLSSFTGSRQELRNIDVQVFWKARLDNNLYPVRMFNLSSVSIKMMFRKKSAVGGGH